MWKLLAPGVGLGDLLTPAWCFSIGFRNCSDSVALFYWIQELFRQRGIFLLDSGTVPTVWYCSIGFRNCSDSVVLFYWIQELFRQCGIVLLDSGTVPTVWYFCFVFHFIGIDIYCRGLGLLV